ncbi:SRPBCC family protein [Xylanimonas sp. McL0601]|uniref:SRPBCC family protein n=1 Tax=Xylanimonas sp. McL0601 TaxID=3414739 RepID=UPI003CE8F678
MSDTTRSTTGSLAMAPLKGAAAGYARALSDRLVDRLSGSIGGLSDRLTSIGDDDRSSGSDSGSQRGASSARGAAVDESTERVKNGENPIKAGLSGVLTGVKEKAKEVFGGGGGGGKASKKFKFNNIVESYDIGAPVDVVFSAWTTYDQWPQFMKKLEHAELDTEENKAKLKGQVFWSHREWETTITDQVPGSRIRWDSTGAKGHISGIVTFHSLGDDLTRIALVLEYHPQGFMEKTANLWRAANRRVRLELKFFIRFVMTEVVLRPDDFEGYWAEIHDGEVTRTHEEVRKERQSDEQSTSKDEQSTSKQRDEKSTSRQGSARSTSTQGNQQRRGRQRNRKSEESGDEQNAETEEPA